MKSPSPKKMKVVKAWAILCPSKDLGDVWAMEDKDTALGTARLHDSKGHGPHCVVPCTITYTV